MQKVKKNVIEQICTKKRIGVSAGFFLKWCTARLENSAGMNSITAVSNLYWEAYNCNVYFAGKYLKQFLLEAITVFLYEYQETKRTRRVKKIFQFASAVGITCINYSGFKKLYFYDSTLNPENIIENVIR